MKIKTGDMVKVIRGKGRASGEQGKVISVNHENNTVLIEGVNLVYKHVRPSQRNPQGGRLHKELPIHVSKVMALCPKTNKATRIGFRFLDDGTKERFAKVSGESMGVVSPAKPMYAKK